MPDEVWQPFEISNRPHKRAAVPPAQRFCIKENIALYFRHYIFVNKMHIFSKRTVRQLAALMFATVALAGCGGGGGGVGASRYPGTPTIGNAGIPRRANLLFLQPGADRRSRRAHGADRPSAGTGAATQWHNGVGWLESGVAGRLAARFPARDCRGHHRCQRRLRYRWRQQRCRRRPMAACDAGGRRRPARLCQRLDGTVLRYRSGGQRNCPPACGRCADGPALADG